MVEPVPDTAPAEVLRKLRNDSDSQIDEGIVRTNVPIIIDLIDRYVLSMDANALIEWGKGAARFMDDADVSRLFRVTSSVFLIGWSKRNGRDELSGVANLLLKAQRAIDEAIFDWDAVKAASIEPDVNDPA